MNRRKFIRNAAGLFAAAQAPIAFPQVFLPHRRRAFAGSGITYLLQENFEQPGFELGWSETDAGSVLAPDYSAAPLVGTYSARVTGSSIAWAASPSFTAQAALYVYFRFKSTGSNPAATRRFFFIRDGSSTDVALLGLNSDGTVLVRAGTTGGNNTAGTLTSGTEYHMWVHYFKGSGANAETHLYLSTTDTKPGSATMFHATGNATTDATHIGFGVTTAVAHPDWVYDKFRVAATEIGSAPA